MLDMPNKQSYNIHRELSWLSQRIEQGRDKIFTEIVTITPTIAQRLLELNADNRRVRAGRVEEIASDILNGRWDLNGESIKVAKTGHLNDGQHRLEAIVKADKPVQTMVVFGLPRDSRYTVDMGSPRTVGDFLGMEGAAHRDNAATAARVHNLWRRGLYLSGAGGGKKSGLSIITKSEVRAEYWRFQKQFDRALGDIANDQFCKRVGVTAIVVAHVILSAVNASAAAMFFQRLRDGANLKQGDAILVLRARLMAVRSERWRPHEKLELILRHWNAWRKNAKMTRALRIERCFPKIEN